MEKKRKKPRRKIKRAAEKSDKKDKEGEKSKKAGLFDTRLPIVVIAKMQQGECICHGMYLCIASSNYANQSSKQCITTLFFSPGIPFFTCLTGRSMCTVFDVVQK
jgi:hypothetical protein